MFVLLVVLAVLLVLSVVIVIVADRLLRLLRPRSGRPDAAAGSATLPPRPQPPTERPATQARPTRRRTDEPGSSRPAGPGPVSPPPSAGRPPTEPPAAARPGPPARPAEPAPPPAESRPRRVQPTPERADEGAGRWGRGRRGVAPERLHLARIEPSTRQRYAQTFQRTSARFAEEPVTALSDADKLVTLLMDERGLPVPVAGADVATDAAQASLLGDYLAAHAIAEASRRKEVSREELEAGMARYQRLVLALLDDGEGAGAGAGAPRA